MTGLPELTQEELQWQNKHQKRVKKVKLNKIGLERINQKRKQNGRWALTAEDVEVVPEGAEIEAAPGATADTDGAIPAADMPGYVDNSQLKYFPPIRSQGSLPTCGSFNGTYYAMTYMWALANDLDAKNGGDDFRLSPKWNNNMLNGGSNSGTWYYWCYDIGIKHGTATWAEFPYDSNYREWCLVPSTWYDAIYRRFDSYGYVNNTDTDTGIEQVKQLLLNGYVLNFPTYINSWQWTTVKDDVSTTEDDAFVSRSIAYWVNGTNGYHAMTVLGYNDNIWTDVNGNGAVDSGEKGAFRIANSWGTGWKEGGFCWMAYDALKGTSAVSGAPSSGRIDGWSPARAHWVTARSHYTPQMVAEFTLEHAKRNQLRVTLGRSDIHQNQPISTWYPQMIAFNGGAYAFDGTTTPIIGTFIFDLTDLVENGSGDRWHLGLYDNTSGSPVDLYSYTIVDVANGELNVESIEVPKSYDDGQLYTSIDYDTDSSNQAPVANISATPTIGEAPLTVYFDGNGSSDADGNIASYQWTFGDGNFANGMNADHTYTQTGQYNVVLTVTDDAGATDSVSVVIILDNGTNSTETVIIQLRQGFNLITIPSDVSSQSDLRDCLSIIGDSTEIEKVMAYDRVGGIYITFIPDGLNNPAYNLYNHEGLIVYAAINKEIAFPSVVCGPIALSEGFNLVGFNCLPENFSAFDLLNALGLVNALSVQKYNTETGRFETASFDTQSGNEVSGVDFRIHSGEGYIVIMKKAVEDFAP